MTVLHDKLKPATLRNLGYDQMICTCINFFQLDMIFMLLLIAVHSYMLEMYF